MHGTKSATKSASLPFFSLLYVIDVVLFIPIARIWKPVDDTSLSGGFFDSVGGFNVETEDEIFSMIFYSEDPLPRVAL